MVLEDMLKDGTTKKFEMDEILIYIYKVIPESYAAKLRYGDDYFVAVFNGDENISRQVGRGLKECYSSRGYVILNSLNINYDLDRVVRYLYEQKYKTK